MHKVTENYGNKNIPQILLWGGSLKTRIIIEMIKEKNLGNIVIIFDDNLSIPKFKTDIKYTNNISILKKIIHNLTHYVVCIGNNGYARFMISQSLNQLGLKPIDILHDESFMDLTSRHQGGLQMMPFSVIHKFCSIGSQVIINTNATIDHDCYIGNGVHIMGSAAIAGGVEIEDFVTVGTNATILPSLKIKKGAYIGAGSVVTKDVNPYDIVIGAPAKFLSSNKLLYNENNLALLLE